jgi:predicted metal-dependent peptidase
MAQSHDELGRDKSPEVGATSKWEKLKLTSGQLKLWDETRTATLWSVPSFSDIWYSMMVDRDGQTAWFTDQVPYAGTDDKIMYLNPNSFFDWTLQERVFVCVHEIAHAMFNHCGLTYNLKKLGYIRYSDGVELPVNDKLLNIAEDYIINDMLVSAKIGKFPTVTANMLKTMVPVPGQPAPKVGDPAGLHDPKLINGDMNVLDAYRILFKKMGGKIGKDGKGQGGNGNGDQAGTGKGFDKHLEPGEGRGKSSSEAQSERNEQAWDNAIAAAMASAKLKGNLPENLERKFLAKMHPQANWEEVYGLAVTRKVGNAAYSWELLDPQLMQRHIGSPGRTAFGCNLIVVAIDSSGSTFQSTVDTFIVETRGILDVIRPKRVIICQCDTRITEWTEIDPGSYDEFSVKVKGGGGTDFCPVFERINKEYEEPDILIYLTDMEGNFPAHAPSYPVVWGSVAKEVKGPFGDTVYIPQQFQKEE